MIGRQYILLYRNEMKIKERKGSHTLADSFLAFILFFGIILKKQ